jgi:beta-glucanase (GH16 family)
LVPPAQPAEPTPPPPARRPIGRIVGTAATALLVLGVLGVVFKIIVRPVPTQPATVATSDSAAPVPPNGSGPATAPAGQPGGPAVPTIPRGDLPGWHQTFAEDFTGNNLATNWNIYNGQPGGDPAGWFSSTHVSGSDGMLTIGAWRDSSPNGHIYVTGGVSNSRVFSQVYGLYKIRFKMDRGWGITYILQLWPTDNRWPPEIDIVEDNGKDRMMTSATLHYGPNDTKLHKEIKGDWTGWHIAELEWSPGKLVYRIDGNQWWLVQNPNVPAIPMSVALQTQASKCGGTWLGCPNSSTPARVNLQVDWVVAYSAQR